MTGFHILAEQKEITSCNFVLVCIAAGILNDAFTVLVKKQTKPVYNICNIFSTMFESRITTKHIPVPRVIVHALPH